MDVTCSGCGVALGGSDVLYTTDGKPVCLSCSANADLLATDKRAAGNIVKAGWGAVGSSLLAAVGQIALMGFMAYFFVAGAIISAAYALKSLAPGNERFSKHLSSGQRSTVQICAIAALIISSLTLLGLPFRLAHF